MYTIHFRQTTTTTPEQLIAGPDGMTDMDVVVDPEGESLKGRSDGLVVGTVVKRFLMHGFRKTARDIEARQDEASPATSDGPTNGLMC
jgi:hypothetical protein